MIGIRAIGRILSFGAGAAFAFAAIVIFPQQGAAQQSGGGNASGTLSTLIQGVLNNPNNPIQLPPSLSGSTTQTIPPSVSTQQSIIQPAPQSIYALNQPQSRLEQIMSARAGVPLMQFGYDLLGSGQAVVSTQVGQVQDDYILGPGDLLDIAMRGQNTTEYRLTVDRDGRLIIPGVAPIAAGGRRFGDFRVDLINAVHKAFVATDAYVSVAQVRQVSVLVTGAVNNPGLRTLTALASPLDAILVSGGIQKNGSLRNVRILRGGQVIPYDLYDIITQHGHPNTVTLADGDRIVVPPLGATVAVTGWVRVPGIYELPSGAAGMTAKGLISLAGGLEVRGRYRLVVMRVGRDGRQEMTELPAAGGLIRDSEILFAEPAASEVVGGATISGTQAMAGQYSIGRSGKLSALLKEPGALGQSPYALFGLVVRQDPHTYVKSLVAFSPAAVLEGRADLDLQSRDFVRIFSAPEAALLIKTVTDYQDLKLQQQENARNPQLAAQFGASPAIPSLPSSLTQQTTPSTAASPSVSNLLAAAQSSSGPVLPQLQPLYQLPFASPQPSAPQAVQPQQTSGSSSQYPGQQNAQTPTLGQQSSVPPYQSQPLPPTNPLLPSAPYSSAAQQPMIVDGLVLDQEQIQNIQPVAPNAQILNFADLVRQLGVDPTMLINFLSDDQVTVEGAVRSPGTYIVGPGTSLQDLVSVAGGTSNWADESGVELTTTAVDNATGRASTQRQVLPLRQGTLASYTVQPHDSIRFSQVYTVVNAGQIVIQGEVRAPGTYTISHGEHLSELLVRAGGLTDYAYPYGTVFLRESVAAVEELGYQRMADEVNKQLLVGISYAAQAGGSGISGDAFAGLQAFVEQLRTQKALGRVSIIADPSMLAAHPDQDPLLEPGDLIFIPQRPSTVTVLGEVMQPGSYPYVAGKSAEDYLALAGGYAHYADDGWTFVVYPDGTAQQLDSSWINLGEKSIPPGTVIFVPRDLFPVNWQSVALNLGELFKDLAVSAASIAVLEQGRSTTTVKTTK